MKEEVNNKVGLVRALGVLEASSIVVGTTIGTGIFIVPSIIARLVHTPGTIFLVWIVAGVLSLAGALTYAELGSAMPRAGGEYVYLKEAYGPLWGFLYGWMMFLVGKTGSNAALATGFAYYLGQFLNLKRTFYSHSFRMSDLDYTFTIGSTQLVAISVIGFLTIVNYFGIKTGGIVQTVLTLLKVAIILALAGLGFSLGKGSFDHFVITSSQTLKVGLLGAFGIAMVKALWAYDGWNNLSMVAGEIKNPKSNLPRALIFGTTAVILIYLLANFVYLYVLPIDKIKASERVAADVAQSFLGDRGASFFAIAVLISSFAALNGSILSGARIYYAMAKDKLFFKRVAALDSNYRTPTFSLGCQAIWGSLLTLTGTYDQLITYVIFSMWIFYGLTAASIFVFRRGIRPSGPSSPSFVMWGYPFIPTIFVVMAFLLTVNTLINDPRNSLVGLVLILLGLPAYFYWRRKSPAG